MRLEDEIKQKEFKNEYQKSIVNIIYTFNWIESKFKDFFKTFDLTHQQFNILRILRGQHPQPCTINLLKDRMLDKMCDASRIVERLRVKSLLERRPSPHDRRSVDIIISDKGLKLLELIDNNIEPIHNTFGSLSQEEVKKLNDLLDKARG
jgi:DNA-binding MarR family transcriptional regulator